MNADKEITLPLEIATAPGSRVSLVSNLINYQSNSGEEDFNLENFPGKIHSFKQQFKEQYDMPKFVNKPQMMNQSLKGPPVMHKDDENLKILDQDKMKKKNKDPTALSVFKKNKGQLSMTQSINMMGSQTQRKPLNPTQSITALNNYSIVNDSINQQLDTNIRFLYSGGTQQANPLNQTSGSIHTSTVNHDRVNIASFLKNYRRDGGSQPRHFIQRNTTSISGSPVQNKSRNRGRIEDDDTHYPLMSRKLLSSPQGLKPQAADLDETFLQNYNSNISDVHHQTDKHFSKKIVPVKQDRGTSTMDESLIDLSIGERSILISVLQEINLEQSFQIKELSDKLATQEQIRHTQHQLRVMGDIMDKVKVELQELGTAQCIDDRVKSMRMAKEAVDRAFKIQMERIQMYKDLNEMMNSSDTNKNLKKKLETYLSGENSKVSFKLLQDDYFQEVTVQLAKQIDQMEYQVSSIKQVQQMDLVSFLNSQIQPNPLIKENASLKKKNATLEKQLNFIKENDTKQNYVLLKEYQNARSLLCKLEAKSQSILETSYFAQRRESIQSSIINIPLLESCIKETTSLEVLQMFQHFVTDQRLNSMIVKQLECHEPKLEDSGLMQLKIDIARLEEENRVLREGYSHESKNIQDFLSTAILSSSRGDITQSITNQQRSLIRLLFGPQLEEKLSEAIKTIDLLTNKVDSLKLESIKVTEAHETDLKQSLSILDQVLQVNPNIFENYDCSTTPRPVYERQREVIIQKIKQLAQRRNRIYEEITEKSLSQSFNTGDQMANANQRSSKMSKSRSQQQLLKDQVSDLKEKVQMMHLENMQLREHSKDSRNLKNHNTFEKYPDTSDIMPKIIQRNLSMNQNQLNGLNFSNRQNANTAAKKSSLMFDSRLNNKGEEEVGMMPEVIHSSFDPKINKTSRFYLNEEEKDSMHAILHSQAQFIEELLSQQNKRSEPNNFDQVRIGRHRQECRDDISTENQNNLTPVNQHVTLIQNYHNDLTLSHESDKIFTKKSKQSASNDMMMAGIPTQTIDFSASFKRMKSPMQRQTSNDTHRSKKSVNRYQGNQSRQVNSSLDIN